MRYRSCLLATIALVLTTASAAQATEVLQAIDQAFQDGQITAGQRIQYRVAAVRAQSKLPERFRKLVPPSAPPTARCHTPVMVEAFQELPSLSPGVRGQVEPMLLPPPDLAYHIDSDAVFPVRVSYGDPSLQDEAERVLAAAEISYAKEVTEWGFWAPPIEPGAERYRFFVMSAGGAAGYTSPYLDVDTTSHADSYSYIVIDDQMSGAGIDITVAHELNHACQLAMDASEQRGFLENTASYIEAQVFPESVAYMVAAFPYFQAHPYRPLEYMNLSDSDLYEYGGALWVLFLEHLYGEDDPRFIRGVWEATVQDGWTNEPDYFDVLDDQLEDGLTEAIRQFQRYRFFVGSDDDGQHLPQAGTWSNSEVWRAATWSSTQLPVIDEPPPKPDVRPQPNGCNYIVLNVAQQTSLPLRFSFSGDDDAGWDVTVLALAAGQAPVEHPLVVDAQGEGAATVSSDGIERMVMLACRLAGSDYDPDAHQWGAASYRYGIELDVPPPTVTGATPAELERGAAAVAVMITGDGFVDDGTLKVALSGAKVAAALEEFVSSSELLVRVVVAPDAALGPRDVIVTNPGGAAGTGAALLTIIEAEPEPSPAAAAVPADDSGCSCRQQSPRPVSSGLLWLGLAAAWLAVRRQRTS